MEYIEQLISYFTDLGVTRGVAITYIIVSALLVIMAIVAIIMRIIVVIKYFEGNHTKTKNGKTSFEVARELLDKAGLEHIKVKKAGIFRAFFFGNSYSLSQKTIFLRGTIANKDSITAVGIAIQKVGIAKLCETGHKVAKTRNIMQILNIFAPIMFVPIVLIGFIIDFALFNVFGVFSIIGIAVGLFLVATGFIATLLNLPVEKKANNMALELIDETGIFDDEEKRIIKKVFDAYIVAYVCEFIVAILRIIQIVLEIVIKVQISKNN